MSGLFGIARAGYSARFNDTSLSTFSFPEAAARLVPDFSLTADLDGRILSISRNRFAIKESCNSGTTSQHTLLLVILKFWQNLLQDTKSGNRNLFSSQNIMVIFTTLKAWSQMSNITKQNLNTYRKWSTIFNQHFFETFKCRMLVSKTHNKFSCKQFTDTSRITSIDKF